MKPLRNAPALALALGLSACLPSDDAASGRSKLVGSYTLVVPADPPKARKDLAGSALRLTRDGMFTQQCRYKNGTTDSAIGTWSYSNRRAQFSVFKDCAGALPAAAGKGAAGASFAVDFDSPIRIIVSPKVNVRYERRGAPEAY